MCLWSKISFFKVVKKLKTGTTPHNSLSPYSEKGIPFLRNTNLQKGELKMTDIKYIKDELKNQLTYSYFGEIIICIAGTVGEAVYNNSKEPLAINQNITTLEVDDNIINPNHLTFYLNTKLNIELVKRLCSIATILYSNNSNLLSLNIPLPPIEKQTEIADHIKAIRTQAKQLKEEAKTLLENAKKEVEQLILGV
ncbi:MAG: restriction endonuclease subunit S [Bacteroidota bacterium]